MSFFALNLWHEQRTWKIVSQYQGRLFLLNSLQNKKLTLLGSCLKTDWMLSEAYINGKQALAQWLINPLLPPKNCWAEGKATIRTAVLEKKRQVSNKLRFCSLPLDSRIFMTSDISEFCRSFHFTFNKHLPGLSVFSRKRKKKQGGKKKNHLLSNCFLNSLPHCHAYISFNHRCDSSMKTITLAHILLSMLHHCPCNFMYVFSGYNRVICQLRKMF